jgi:hypothetical protein
MITRKQYRTLQKLKPIAIATIVATTLIATNIITKDISDKQLQQEAQAYKQCIIKQSEEQGWIIRSACSSNYKQLDKIANLKYKQIKLDLYLEQ